ncbi:MAG: ABC transporter permease [Candidatus Riflebacteria bacterium]|nr:ABC transporter permease [Candidatus Riflebacteria bacterium]
MDTAFVIATIGRAFTAGTPLLLATLGEIIAERAGVMNLGIEGMMALGAVAGFGVSLESGSPWLGMLAAALAGISLSAIHAFVTIGMRAGQIVSGIALTMFGLGLSALIGKGYIGRPLQTPLHSITIPGLADLPFIGDILFRRDPIFYFAIIIAALIWIILYKTRWGIAIRSVGENPLAAETMGVDVAWVRVWCVLFGGALSGIAGGYLSIVYNPSWIEGMTAGRGWIVIALVIFSFWNPLRAVVAAFLFGGIDVMQFSLQSLGISPNLLRMFPYVATIVALLITSSSITRRHISAPEALGEPYQPR